MIHFSWEQKTKTVDVVHLEEKDEEEKKLAESGAAMREELEAAGEIDQYEKMQPERPRVDENLIGARMEQL